MARFNLEVVVAAFTFGTALSTDPEEQISITERISGGCLVPLIIYPLVVLFFCLAWKRSPWLPCFAENYSLLVNHKRQRDNKTETDDEAAARDQESQQLIRSGTMDESETTTLSAEDASKELSVFSWFSLTFVMNDDLIRNQAGCDAVMFIGLIRRMTILFLALMVCNCLCLRRVDRKQQI